MFRIESTPYGFKVTSAGSFTMDEIEQPGAPPLAVGEDCKLI